MSLRQKRNQDTKTVLTTRSKYTNVNEYWNLGEQSGFGTKFVPKNLYRGAGKSLARPRRKQANVSVRMAWISFGVLPCRKKKTWWQLASRCCWNLARPWHASELVSFLVGLRTYQHFPLSLNFSPCSSEVLFISDFNSKSNASTNFRKTKKKYEIEISLWIAIFVRTDRRMDGW